MYQSLPEQAGSAGEHGMEKEQAIVAGFAFFIERVPLMQVLLNVTVPQKSCQDAYELVLREFKKKVKVGAISPGELPSAAISPCH
jgi:hypothetical protein